MNSQQGMRTRTQEAAPDDRRWMLAPVAKENIREEGAGSKWGRLAQHHRPQPQGQAGGVSTPWGCHPDRPAGPGRARKGPLAHMQRGMITRVTQFKALFSCSRGWKCR